MTLFCCRSFSKFRGLHLPYEPKCKIIIYQFILICSFYKTISGNLIDGMKFCFNISDLFKLFEIVVLANFHDKYFILKNKKVVVIILSFFCFCRKTMT